MLELRDIYYEAEEDGVRHRILDGVSLTVGQGFTALTGPNGGGKSTLAKIIAGLYKPTSGRVIFNGTDITDASVTDRARMGIAFAFQQPVRFKGITVKDLIGLAKGQEISVSEACRYLSEVGLCAKEYIDREVNASLSGGECKRIEIATVMARNAALTIFDEPEAGIDLWSFSNLIKVFEQLQETNGGSMLIISHQERILSIADRVVVIADGKITAQGKAGELMPGILSGYGVCRTLEEKM